MSGLFGPIVLPAATGGDGSATATATSTIKASGILYGVYAKYAGDDPATMDMTVATLGTDPSAPSYNLLVATDLVTDKMYLPRAVSHVATTGVASTTADQCQPVEDFVKVTIAQANDQGIDVSDFLEYLIDKSIPKGQGLTTDFLHALMYQICPTVDENGKRVTLSRMNTVQAAQLFDRFRTIVAPMGIVIEDPNPSWRDKCSSAAPQ